MYSSQIKTQKQSETQLDSEQTRQNSDAHLLMTRDGNYELQSNEATYIHLTAGSD